MEIAGTMDISFNVTVEVDKDADESAVYSFVKNHAMEMAGVGMIALGVAISGLTAGVGSPVGASMVAAGATIALTN